MSANHGKSRVLVFAGPTGGHLFPSLAFLEAYQETHPDSSCSLVTGKRGQGLLTAEAKDRTFKIYYLMDTPAPRSLSLKSLLFLIKLVLAFLQSAWIIVKVRPQLCVGFGSYVSFPGMMLSSWFGIPTLVHEQNAVMGKANEKLIARASKVALSLPVESLAGAKKAEVVGMPLRKSIAESQSDESLSRKFENKFVLLVVGGSQGAQKINSGVVDMFRQLSLEERSQIAVIHIAGNKDYSGVLNSYKELGMAYEVEAFTSEIAKYYHQANLAITRAGAGTLAELSYFSLPSIIVPYPHAENHQLENAKQSRLAKGSSICVEQQLTTDYLAGKVRDALSHYQHHSGNSVRNSEFGNTASGRMVEISDELMGVASEVN